MIKAIIFDFDGVIVESVDIKTDAFRELFKDYPEFLEEFIEYHLINGGVSRFEKVRFFYQTFLRRSIGDRELEKLCRQYSELVLEKVVVSEWVKGMPDMLRECHGRYQMFVVSGTPEDEVRLIVRRRGIDRYFKGVYGSPRTKNVLVRFILKRFGFTPNEAIFIGDSVTDLEGAKCNGVRLIARCHGRLPAWRDDPAVAGTCEDMSNIFQLIEEIK